MFRPALTAMLMLIAVSIPAAAADKLTVLLDWFVNPDHAPLVVAEQKGFFEAQGLDVKLVQPADPSAPPRLVAAKQGDIAVSYQPVLHSQIDEGLPLVAVGVLVETPLNALITKADGPVQNLEDLKGRKVGFSVAGFEDALLSAMLKSVGLAATDIELVNVNFSLSPALLSGQVDAVIGGYRNFELTQIALEGHKGKAFYPEEHSVPAYDELIYIVHEDATGDTRFRRFLSAVEAATIYLTNHPEEAWKAFITAYPNLDDELNRQAWFDTLPRFAKRPSAVDLGRYDRFATFLHDSGMIKSIVPATDYVKALQ